MGKRSGGGGGGVALDAVDSLINENQSIVNLIERVNKANDSKLNINDYINEVKDLLPNYDSVIKYSEKLKQFDKDLVSSWYNKNLTPAQKELTKKLRDKSIDIISKSNLEGQKNLSILENTGNKLTSYLKNNGYSNYNTNVDLFRNKISLAGDKSFKNKEQLKQKGYKFNAGSWNKEFSINNIISEVKSLLE